jgi:hypothetical protein
MWWLLVVFAFAFAQTSSVPIPPLTPRAVLGENGLTVGKWNLPLKGSWLPLRIAGNKAFTARSSVVVEVDLVRPGATYRFAPAEVRAIEIDSEPVVVLESGQRLALSAFAGRAYEGNWDTLSVMQDLPVLENAPYWYYFARAPQLGAGSLEAIGKDLLQRGHRPELPWGTGVLQWLKPWLDRVYTARREGLSQSLQYSEFFLRYMPLVPGAQAMFTNQASWLEAQGRPDLAQRYREGLRQIAAWQNPVGPSTMAALAWGSLALYVLIMLYLVLIYLPVQIKGLKGLGGWLFGWFSHPLLRIRHGIMAYTTLGERLLLLGLFLLTAGSWLAWGFVLRADKLINQEGLARGTLRSNIAQEALRAFPNSPSMQGLLAYALAKENPEEAKRLLDKALPWTYVLVNRNTPESLAQALRQAPESVPVRQALGIGSDLWTPMYQAVGLPREGVPTPRVIAAAVGISGVEGWNLAWRDLPVWPSVLWAWIAAAVMGVLAIYHVFYLLVPRPVQDNNLSWREGVQLFFPGSPWYSQGWGVLLLMAFVAAIWWWQEGSLWGIWGAAAIVVLHLSLWFVALSKAR